MLWKLFKIQMVSSYRNMFLMGRNSGKKRSPIMVALLLVLVVYTVGSVMISSGYMFYSMATSLIPIGMGWFYFAFAGMLATGVGVMLTIFMTQSILYEARDNELLLSMPIKPAHILGSRLGVIAVFEYVTYMLFLLCSGVIYAYVARPPMLYYVFFAVGVLLLPLLGITIASLVGYILSALTSRMHNRAPISLLFSLMLMGLYLWGYQAVINNMDNMVEVGLGLSDTLRSYLVPFYYFGKSIADQNLLSFLLFALCCLIPFGVMYYLLSISFAKLVSTGHRTKKVIYRREKMQGKSPFTALFIKEVRKFFSTPMYLLNSGLSFILSIFLGIFLLIKGEDIFTSLLESMPQMSQHISVGVTIAVCFLAAMGMTTSPSISLEGKRFWILRSLPVGTAVIFKAKLWLNILFGGVTLLFADICVIFKLKFSLTEAILLILLTLGVQVFTAIEGLICNLLLPKLDAANDNVVVKQSASVLVSMLISLALVATLAIGYAGVITIMPTISVTWILVAETIAVILLNLGGYHMLMTKGVKLFENL